MKTILLSTILLVGLLSCKSKKNSNKTVKLENSTWEVISLSNKEVTSKQTLILANDKISGKAACNKYSGRIKLGEKKTIKVSEVLSTKMGCDKLDEEQLFFTNMQKVSNYEISKNDELSFYNTDKVLLVKLKKID